MKTRSLVLCLLSFFSLTLASCTGIPFRTLPRLMNLQADLLTANPAEIMFAVQVDARLQPPGNAVPSLEINVRPTEPNSFAAIKTQLPMRLVVSTGVEYGLPAARAQRHWLVYNLLPDSQVELERLQKLLGAHKNQPQSKGGMQIGIGIAQEAIALSAPALAGSRWESWLQVSRKEGFFELWSGTTFDLLDTVPR